MASMLDRGFIPPAVDEFLLRGLRPDDRVRVGAVGRRVSLSHAVAGNSPELKKLWASVFALPPVEWLGPSRIWDGLADVVEILGSEPGRRAIILVSDGQAGGNLRGYREAGAAAKFVGASISVIGQESLLPTSPPKAMASVIGRDPLSSLRELAEMTGGRFFLDKASVTPGEPCFVRDPSKYLAQSLDRLHQVPVRR